MTTHEENIRIPGYETKELSFDDLCRLGLDPTYTTANDTDNPVLILLPVYPEPVEVQADIVGDMRLRILDGKPVGLILCPSEGDAGYFGPRSTVVGSPVRDGGDIPNEDYDKAQKCMDEGFMFPNDWEFPSWIEWVC